MVEARGRSLHLPSAPLLSHLCFSGGDSDLQVSEEKRKGPCTLHCGGHQDRLQVGEEQPLENVKCRRGLFACNCSGGFPRRRRLPGKVPDYTQSRD